MPATKRLRSPVTIIILITLLGAALRLLQLAFQPLWWDEGYSVWFAGQSIAEMVRLTAEDIHPPLYYGLLHIWTLIFGVQPVSLRLFSVFVSLPAIPLAYALGRDMRDRTTGYLAAGLVAINPFAIFYAQEIRMYGLAATLSLAAMWTGWRWGMVSRKDAKAQKEENGAGKKNAGWKWGVAYGLSVLAGLYTLYLFALLPLAQFIWILIARRQRIRAWLVMLVAAGMLYLPWALYAGPKLLNYVAYKVVKDNDQPLPLLIYLGRHLSAFVVGHLEGPLATLWPWALLLLIPPLVALALPKPASAGFKTRLSALASPVGYLTIILTTALLIGFIQQMQAPFIPERFERVLLFAAPALWLLLALGTRELWRESRLATAIFLLALVGMQAASLAAFYTTPRYADRDYRPLIETVAENLRPGDSVFAIYPWQAGYFLAYLPWEFYPTLVNVDAAPIPPRNETTPIVLSPDEDWTPAVQQSLDDLRQRGGVWFPEHLSLGGIFETKVEDYLGENAYQLMNQWYGEETRLTGWDEPRGVGRQAPLVTPQDWENGVSLADGWYVKTPYRAFFELDWEGSRAIKPADLAYTLWLRGPDGNRWAQRDVTPFAHPWPELAANAPTPWRDRDHIGLTLPAGAPPGDYDLVMALLRPDLSPIATAGPNPAPEAWVQTLALPQAIDILPRPAHPADIQGDGIEFLGYERGDGPFLTGDDIAVDLYWRPWGPLSPDHYVFLQLLDGGGQMVAGMEGPPIPWLPTSQWPEATLRSQLRLRVPADLAPGEYRMIAGLFDPQSGERIRWGKKDALALGKVAIEARPHDFQPPSPRHPLNLTLQGGHKLLGYDLVARTEPGAPVNLILYWRPDGPTDSHYSVFVHLIDHDGDILAQDDSEPAGGEHPTTSWVAGEIITDAHAFPFPAADAEGPFGLEVGLYDPLTGQRVPFVDDAGNIIADHIVLPLE